MGLFVAMLEAIATRYGTACVVDSGVDRLLQVVYGGLAHRFAPYLSECAQTFFGV